MREFRGLVALFAPALIALGLTEPASAQAYPTHNVRLIVPFAAGGPTDVIARVVAQKLSEAWGQQIVVENVPGAGGNTGVAMVAKAAPDGYTMLVVSTGFIVNPSMYAKVPYDPIKDFAPVTLVAASPNVISANLQVPAKIAQGTGRTDQGQSGQVQLRAAGHRLDPASRGRTVQAQVQSRPRHRAVQRRGAGDQLDARRPHADRLHGAAAGDGQRPRGQAASGVALLSTKRSPQLPDVPTNVEAGVPDLESDTLTGIVAPAGTPKEIVDRWRNEIAKAVQAPDVKQRLETLGFAPVADTPAEFGERLKTEMARWGKVVRDAKIKAD